MRFRIQTFSRCCAGMALLFVAAAGTAGQTQPPPTNTSNSGTITGKVVNESGQPLPNAIVWVHAIGAQAAGQMVTSDQEGKFKLTSLQRVPYSITASMPAYMTPPRGRDEKGQYEIGDSVTLVLVKGGVITGKVVSPDGEPVVAIGVRVEMIRDATGRRITSAPTVQENPTDDRGIYRIYGLPTGTYIVMVGGGTNDYSRTGINAFDTNVPTYAPSSTRDEAAEISLRAGEELTDVDIRYRGEPGRSISGTIRGPIREEWGFGVTLTSIGDGGLQRNESIHQDSNSREFVFSGIADGDYYLTAHGILQTGEQSVSESKLVKIRGADVTGIELLAQPLASVSGRVVLEETKAPECTDKKRPVFTETSVSAWHKEQEPGKDRARFIWSMGSPVRADAQGNVKLHNLAAGEYRFVTQFSGKEWYLQSISFVTPGQKTPPVKPVDAMKTWTRVKPGDSLSGLTVTLAQGAASLSGELALGEGETVPEKLVVYLVPVEREKADDVLRFYAAPVDGEGDVELNNIAPGRYWILVQPAIDSAESPLTKLRLPDEAETRLRLRRAAEAAKTEVELKPCQSIEDFQIKP